jgi:hypothetical protein
MLRKAIVAGSTMLVGLFSAGTFAWAQSGSEPSGQGDAADQGQSQSQKQGGSSKQGGVDENANPPTGSSGAQGAESKGGGKSQQGRMFGLDVSKANALAQIGQPGSPAPIGVVAFTDQGKRTKVEVRIQKGTPGKYDLQLDATGACAWKPSEPSGAAGGYGEEKKQPGAADEKQPGAADEKKQPDTGGSSGGMGSGGQGEGVSGSKGTADSNRSKGTTLGQITIDKDGNGKLTKTVSTGAFAGNSAVLEHQVLLLVPPGGNATVPSAACGMIEHGQGAAQK